MKNDAFEEATLEYRRAVAAADRLRLRALVGLGEKPSEEEKEAAEKRVKKAFLGVSRAMGISDPDEQP